MLEFHRITLDETLRMLRKNSESKKSDILEELRTGEIYQSKC